MKKQQKKINLALQGGGSHGAFTWGILDRLLERNVFDIDGISATSAGSMNAVILAQGMLDGGPEQARKLLFEFWKTVSELGELIKINQWWPIDFFLQPFLKVPLSLYLFLEFTSLISPYQFNPYNYHPLQDILENLVDFKNLKSNSKIKLFICATNVMTGKLRIFENDELCMDVILASACLPKLFQAVKIDQEFYWDGGYLGNPALFPLIYNTSTKDILILHTVPMKRPEVPTTIFDIDTRLREISFNSSLSREMRVISFVSSMIENQWIKPEFSEKLNLQYIHCLNANDIMIKFSHASVMSSDWKFLLSLKESGRKKADEWLEENFSSVGKKSTIHYEDWI